MTKKELSLFLPEQMKDKSRITIEVEINAPRSVVGQYVDNLTLISSFHPKVKRVDLLSGQEYRAEGVKYQCVIPKGNKEWTCIEEVTAYEKDKRMVTVSSGGSMNLEKFLGGFTSELIYTDLEEGKTLLTLRNYYSPKGFVGNFMDIFFKWKFKEQFSDTFNALKRLIEKEYRDP